ncbi:MAG: hypothetical protein DHS20C16_08350 [Phycisphaerae bacterium]|nr:MAG: hypothetical protein DHS20C16_08350 [Phycisphaerae bacterium]
MRIFIAILLSCTSLALGDNSAPGASDTKAEEQDRQRIEAVRSYMTSANAAERKLALKQLSDATHPQLAHALGDWKITRKTEESTATIDVEIPGKTKRSAKLLKVEIKLPKEYGAQNSYPLVIALHGQGGNGRQFIRAVNALLGEQAEAFIIAAPTEYGGMWLGASADESAEPIALIDALKHRYAIDTDRIYVLGYSLGGHASFLMATLYKDQLAAAVPLSGTCAIQMGAECLDVLLPNIHSTPVLAVYGADDQSKNASTGEPAGIAVWNRYIKQQAAELKLPITMIELPGVGHGGVIPPKEALKDILSTKRAPLSKTVAHRFRYTTQARDGWLRQTQFSGKPWTSQQLIVSPANGETVAEAMAAMLREKLGYIGGTIDGQTINIETHLCGRIEVLLNEDLVDLDKPITIIVDGTIRFEGVAKRNTKTMLDIAKEDWEFQRLFPVRFQIGRKGKAIQR